VRLTDAIVFMQILARATRARLPRRGRLRLAALCLTAAACAAPAGLARSAAGHVGPASGNLVLPDLGDAAAAALSPTAERRLGDRIMRSIRRDPALIDDPLLLEYVESLWQSLLRAGRQRGDIGTELDAAHAWEAFLVRDRSVNAFALPGGYIGVHLGLVAMTATSDELASVLAHELAHVTQRHIARMIGQQAQMSWVSVASLLLGVLAASSNPAAAQAMIAGGQAVAIQNQLNFSRDMEREADRVGFGVLMEGGFDPAGMAGMFEQLAQASRLNDDGSFPYLRTHPLTTERIGEARARLGTSGWAGTARRHNEVLATRHALMAARARVLADVRQAALQSAMRLSVRPDAEPLSQLAAHYTRAVALQRGGLHDDAAAALQSARQAARLLPTPASEAAERILILTEAEGLLAARRADDAMALLSRQVGAPRVGLNAASRPERMLLAEAALQASEAPAALLEAAASRLELGLADRPQDASAWALLARAWTRLGHPVRAVRAEAEAAAALGDLPGAIDRVEGAQRRFRQPDAGDTIELSAMLARARGWQRQLQEDLRER